AATPEGALVVRPAAHLAVDPRANPGRLGADWDFLIHLSPSSHIGRPARTSNSGDGDRAAGPACARLWPRSLEAARAVLAVRRALEGVRTAGGHRPAQPRSSLHPGPAERLEPELLRLPPAARRRSLREAARPLLRSRGGFHRLGGLPAVPDAGAGNALAPVAHPSLPARLARGRRVLPPRAHRP